MKAIFLFILSSVMFFSFGEERTDCGDLDVSCAFEEAKEEWEEVEQVMILAKEKWEENLEATIRAREVVEATKTIEEEVPELQSNCDSTNFRDYIYQDYDPDSDYDSWVKCNLQNVDFGSRSFYKANFRGADFSSSNVSRARVIASNCSYAIFIDSSVHRAEFINSNCSYADFSRAYLARTKYWGTDLRYAIFTDVYLVDFSYADVRGVDFTNTKNVRFATFTGAKVTPEQAQYLSTIGIKDDFVIVSEFFPYYPELVL